MPARMDAALGWLLAGGGRMRDRVARGMAWMLLGSGAERAASLVKLAILGRLLAPHDFGLMGIAMLVLRFLDQFTETGFDSALIRKKEDVRPYLDSAWTVQVARSFALAGLLALGAPLCALFFDNPEAEPIVRAVALVMVCRGLVNPGVVLFRREMTFQRDVVWRVGGVAANLAVAIPLAFARRDVWALVISLVAGEATKAVLSHLMADHRPRLRPHWGRVRELARFGKWVFGANVATFIGMQVDALVVANLLGAAALGFYQVAYQIATLPTLYLGRHLRAVLLPALSRLETEAARRHAVHRTLRAVGAVVLPAACFTSLFAEPLLTLIAGPRWAPAALPLAILAWGGMATGAAGVLAGLFYAAGHPSYVLRTQLAMDVVLLALVLPLSRFGIAGVAAAATAAMLVWALYRLHLAARLVGARITELMACFRLGAAGCAPFAAAWLLASYAGTRWWLAAAAAGAAWVGLMLGTLRAELGGAARRPSGGDEAAPARGVA